MSIELTAEQLASIDGQPERPVRVIDPRTNGVYVLVAEAEYASCRELLADEVVQNEIRQVGWRNAVNRLSARQD